MNTIRYKTYQKALKQPEKEWAINVIKRWKEQANKEHTVKKYRKENLSEMTSAESKFKDILDSMSIQYVREQTIRRGKNFYFIDFFLPKPLNLGFEIDGGIHKKRMLYDYKRDMEIMSRDGIAIIRYSNEDVLFNPSKIKTNVERIIKEKWQSHINSLE